MSFLSRLARCVRASFLAIVFLIATTVHATTYYVDDSIPSSGSGLFSFDNSVKTIQEALLLAGAGDVIRVGEGE